MGLYDKSHNPRQSITEKDVKLCELCGALNYNRNSECYICGWRGAFSSDGALVHMAMNRLYDQFECVEMAHITGKKTSLLADFGSDIRVNPRSKNRFAQWLENLWRALVAKRNIALGSRESNTRNYPQNGLGV